MVYEFLFCIAHFIGDGVGTHGTAQSFFALIGSQSDEQLTAWLNAEWTCRWGKEGYPKEIFPRHAESAIPRPVNEIQAKAWKIDFEKDQARLVVSTPFFPHILLLTHLFIDRPAIPFPVSHPPPGTVIQQPRTSSYLLKLPLTSLFNVNRKELPSNKLFLLCAILLGFGLKSVYWMGGKRKRSYR